MRVLCTAIFLCCVASCDSQPLPPPSPSPSPQPQPQPQPTLSGDRLAYRFVDHAGEARYEGPAIAPAWTALSHPQRSLLPWSRLDGDAAYLAVDIALADADVEDYATGIKTRRHPVRALDPVWNRTRAVYASRAALYVPAGGTQRFTVAIPSDARLETAIAALAPGVHASITLDGKTLAAVDVDRDGIERWTPLAIHPTASEPGTHELAFSATGGAAFFADPLLWQRGGGAAGVNVLVILVDTLRLDALAVMPHVKKLADRGARFDQAITAATWTRPSLLALYGGDLPSAVGQSAEAMIPEDADRQRFYRIAPPLLPRLLAARGWLASAIGNNFFLLAYPQIGLDMGFESVDDVRHPVLDTPAITRAALRFLDENHDRAWLLHLHYDAPHWPYTPPPQYLARTNGVGDAALQKDPEWQRYLAEAAYADDYVGKVLDGLAARHLEERTLVILLGDHGEVFDPAHDHFVKALDQPTLHHHGWSAYDEILRVPLVMALPKVIPPATIPSQVSTVDVAATIADVLGLDKTLLPARARGSSLLPLVKGLDHDERAAVAEGQDVRALREKGWLYLQRSDGRLVVKGKDSVVTEELYEMASDAAQHDNRAARDDKQLAMMRKRLADLTPALPEPKTPIVHLELAPEGGRGHHLEGTIHAVSGWITVRAASGGTVKSIDKSRVRVDLTSSADGSASCDLAIDPPDAALEMALVRDGVAWPARRILLGGLALPIADSDTTIAGASLRRLDASRPPESGARGDVLLWRDATNGPQSPSASATPSSEMDEVKGMMERWGYANKSPAPK